MLKGTTRIELTNVTTGEVEVIEKHNLVTNAIPDLLQLNPDGYLFDGSYDLASDLLPICPNAIGGILLYGEPLEEDPAKYYAPDSNPLIGYSSNNINESTDAMRGSLNLNESGVLDGNKGYRFVFDFATSQANGTIASLGLTSKYGGKSGYGSILDAESCVKLLSQKYTAWSSAGEGKNSFAACSSIVSVDHENGVAYFAYVSAASTVEVGKIRLGELALASKNGPVSANILKNTSIKTSVFAPSLTSNASKISYTTFLDGNDGYIWGFGHAGNADGNSSGTAEVLWIKISKGDFSFVEGSWDVNAQLFRFGYRATAGTTPQSFSCAIIHNGRLYCVSKTRESIMAISLSNPSDVISINPYKSPVTVPGSANSYYSACLFNRIGNIIYCPGNYIENNKACGVATSNIASSSVGPAAAYPFALKGPVAPGLTVGPYLLGYWLYTASDTFRMHRTVYLMTAYLATINNLDTPVTKTADKTMKITYILREE